MQTDDGTQPAHLRDAGHLITTIGSWRILFHPVRAARFSLCACLPIWSSHSLFSPSSYSSYLVYLSIFVVVRGQPGALFFLTCTCKRARARALPYSCWSDLTLQHLKFSAWPWDSTVRFAPCPLISDFLPYISLPILHLQTCYRQPTDLFPPTIFSCPFHFPACLPHISQPWLCPSLPGLH